MKHVNWIANLRRRPFIVLMSFVLFQPTSTSAVLAEESTATLTASVTLRSFFARYCNDCHSEGTVEGGLDLLNLGDDLKDAAIAKSTQAPEPDIIEATYRGTREAEKFVGRIWRELEDGAVVRFSGGGYPSGMLRGSGVRRSGRYRIRVTEYAYQSKKPITFSVGGTSFARGSEKPIYGFFSFPPDQPSTVEMEAWIESNYKANSKPRFAPPDCSRWETSTARCPPGWRLSITSRFTARPARRLDSATTLPPAIKATCDCRA